MSSTSLIAPRRVSPLEGIAWYWLWSGTLCLWLVPAARETSARFGWMPLWLAGAPLALLVVHFVLSWARRWSANLAPRAASPRTALLTPTDLAAIAQRLRAPVVARAPAAARALARGRARRLAAVALFSR